MGSTCDPRKPCSVVHALGMGQEPPRTFVAALFLPMIARGRFGQMWYDCFYDKQTERKWWSGRTLSLRRTGRSWPRTRARYSLAFFPLPSRVRSWAGDTMSDMTQTLKDVMKRVESWPEERQADAAKVLLEMEAQGASSYHLTDEQLAEVRRRRAVKNPKTISLAELDNRLRRRGI